MRRAFLVFLLLGLVSLTADIAYEGARSILGAYIEILGGTAILAGALCIGDFLGYSARLVSGFISAKLRSSRSIWAFTIAGYTTNLIAVPMLALARNPSDVLTLVIVERLGKGLRTPARDVILAEVTESLGRGKGFGIHEAMDQIGAITGPLLIAFTLSTTRSYPMAFTVLAIPAAIAVALIAIASRLYPELKSVSYSHETSRSSFKLSSIYWIYIAAIAMISASFVHWALISFHIRYTEVLPDEYISLLYTVAMGIDAAVAIVVGLLYDRIGLKTLLMVPLLQIPIPFLVFTNNVFSILLGATLWGSALGINETILRASIADLVEPSQRPLAYGIYSFVYGIAWMSGSIVIGYLYTLSLELIYIFIVSLSMMALTMLTIMMSKIERVKRG